MPVMGVTRPAATLDEVSGSSRSTTWKGMPRHRHCQAKQVPASPCPTINSRVGGLESRACTLCQKVGEGVCRGEVVLSDRQGPKRCQLVVFG